MRCGSKALFGACHVLLAVFCFSLSTAYATIAIDKAFHLVKDPMVVSVTGLTQEQINTFDARVGIFLKGDTLNSDALSSMYVSSLKDEQTWNHEAPSKLGDYEIRIYWSLPDNSKYVLESLPFTVGSLPAAPGAINISATSLLVRDKVTVTITGLTPGQISTSAFAGVFLTTDALQSSSFESISTFVSSLRDDMTWTFDAPRKYGDYEVRVFTSDVAKENRTPVFYGKVSFSVVSNPAKPGSIALNKSSFAVGESAVATITGLTPGQVGDSAFVGVYLGTDILDARSVESIFNYFSNLRDGMTWTFNVPSTPGSYQLRVFTSGDQDRAKSFYGSVNFTVNKAVSPQDYRIQVKPKKEFKIKVGKAKALTVSATPKQGGDSIAANAMVSFESKNPKIATVDPTGLVRGVKSGKTTILVRFGESTTKVKVIVK